MHIHGPSHGYSSHQNTFFPEDKTREKPEDDTRVKGPSADPEQDISAGEKHELDQLKQRDREVRTHETAHKAAGGGLTGSIQYEYKTGADGKRYAVGGEVSIDTSEERSPEATLQKAQRIRAAALAPADPSAQDRAVAGKAAQMAVEARTELLKEQRDQRVQIREQHPNGASNEAAREFAVDPGVAIRSYSSLASESSSGDAIDIIA